jgi:hypothetical protein
MLVYPASEGVPSHRRKSVMLQPQMLVDKGHLGGVRASGGMPSPTPRKISYSPAAANAALRGTRSKASSWSSMFAIAANVRSSRRPPLGFLCSSGAQISASRKGPCGPGPTRRIVDEPSIARIARIAARAPNRRRGRSLERQGRIAGSPRRSPSRRPHLDVPQAPRRDHPGRSQAISAGARMIQACHRLR